MTAREEVHRKLLDKWVCDKAVVKLGRADKSAVMASGTLKKGLGDWYHFWPTGCTYKAALFSFTAKAVHWMAPDGKAVWVMKSDMTHSTWSIIRGFAIEEWLATTNPPRSANLVDFETGKPSLGVCEAELTLAIKRELLDLAGSEVRLVVRGDESLVIPGVTERLDVVVEGTLERVSGNVFIVKRIIGGNTWYDFTIDQVLVVSKSEIHMSRLPVRCGDVAMEDFPFGRVDEERTEDLPCPDCCEDRIHMLVWLNDEDTLHCTTCGCEYRTDRAEREARSMLAKAMDALVDATDLHVIGDGVSEWFDTMFQMTDLRGYRKRDEWVLVNGGDAPIALVLKLDQIQSVNLERRKIFILD